MKIRPTKPDDLRPLQRVVRETELFPPEMLPDMIGGFLSPQGSQDLWLTCEDQGEAIGFCYAAPEEMTEGTWNMLALAVLPDRQGQGAGKAIVRQLEDDLRSQGQRVVIVDTSSADAYADTREFYRRCGYVEEARIRDFWSAGDDKIVFWKAL